jgi:hypothetical protein
VEILKLSSLDKLSRFVKEDPDYRFIATVSFDDIVDELSLEFVELAIPAIEDTQVTLDATLIDPADIAASDPIQSPLFYQAISSLSPALATDERIWTTLSLGRFNDYTKARWQKIPEPEEKARNWIKAHWLCGSNNRAKFRDNSISRLWWMGRVSHSIPGWAASDVAKLMITSTDYRQQLLDRTTSFTAIGVAKAILEISLVLKSQEKTLSRIQFRSVMKEVNFVAGRANLATLSDRQLIEIFQPIFSKAIET